MWNKKKFCHCHPYRDECQVFVCLVENWRKKIFFFISFFSSFISDHHHFYIIYKWMSEPKMMLIMMIVIIIIIIEYKKRKIHMFEAIDFKWKECLSIQTNKQKKKIILSMTCLMLLLLLFLLLFLVDSLNSCVWKNRFKKKNKKKTKLDVGARKNKKLSISFYLSCVCHKHTIMAAVVFWCACHMIFFFAFFWIDWSC